MNNHILDVNQTFPYFHVFRPPPFKHRILSSSLKSWYKAKDDDCSNDESTNKDRPTKVSWYLRIIPRFKQLFANGDDAKNLTWHADGRKGDRLLQYLADSS